MADVQFPLSGDVKKAGFVKKNFHLKASCKKGFGGSAGILPAAQTLVISNTCFYRQAGGVTFCKRLLRMEFTSRREFKGQTRGSWILIFM